MDLNQLITDLKEIKSTIREYPIQAEDLLEFIIREINAAAQPALAVDTLSEPACCASFVAYGTHHENCRFRARSYCTCENPDVYINRICKTCSKPHAPRL